MKLKQLEELVKHGESHTLEFKSSLTQLKPALETLCAFLNSDGGVVAIGVNDKGKIIGQSIADKTKQDIAHEIGKIEPSAHIEVDYVPVSENKTVVVLQTKKGLHAPYAYDGRAYQREQSIIKKMSQHRYNELVSQRKQLNFSWEKFIATGYGVDDLDHNLILGVVRKAVEVKRMPEEALRQDIREILDALELFDDGDLINAAVALFGKKLKSDFIQCQLKVARFKGIDRDEFLDSDSVRGNIFSLLEVGMLFVRKHLPVASKFEEGNVERIDIPLIPFNAVREALINALCHRDYSSSGGDIGLAIYDDRMEIFNIGGLTEGLTLEKIKAGASKRRNPIIADVLHRCNLIEKWGRGIRKIINLCAEAGDPEPEFDVQWDTEFKVIFRFPKNIAPPNITKIDLVAPLTERQEKIISILKDHGPLATELILKELREPITTRTLRRDLSSLQERGLVELTGRTTISKWVLVLPKDI